MQVITTSRAARLNTKRMWTTCPIQVTSENDSIKKRTVWCENLTYAVDLLRRDCEFAPCVGNRTDRIRLHLSPGKLGPKDVAQDVRNELN